MTADDAMKTATELLESGDVYRVAMRVLEIYLSGYKDGVREVSERLGDE